MLKVELESDGRLHSEPMEGLWRKLTESRSLFQRDSERHVVSDWVPVVCWRRDTRHWSVMIGGSLQWGLRQWGLATRET